MPSKTQAPKYQQLDPIEHIIKRPDMYVGSIVTRENEQYISIGEGFEIQKKSIRSSPAFIRIFIEAISNAIDNSQRSKEVGIPCTAIKVNIDKETGLTSVWNDGDIVPIEFNEGCKCYNHTMIFGKLLTGSNYDDEEERMVAGRNGLGIKLCNVFSKEFTVEGVDPVNKKILKQTWRNNMRDTTGPVVKSYSKTKGYTMVSWVPDFDKFKLKGYTTDLINLYTRYVIDAAMISGVAVYMNNTRIPVNSLSKYSCLYESPTDEKVYMKTETCEVVLIPSNTGFNYISFVNGVFTKLGGEHVDAWSECIFRQIVDKFNKKKNTKTPKININDVKQFFTLFVVANVVRPEFDGQDKNKLESPSVKADIKSNTINSIMKWSVIDNIYDIIKAREMLVLKKSEKTKKHVKIDGFDPANNAGGKHSSECTLIICEGLSAKTYAVAGIQHGVYGHTGRDWFGILPLTGKILNVRNSAPTTIACNKVVTNIIQALGIKHGVDYTQDKNYKTLNYGKLMVMTDADCDGIHIEGLIMNFIHSLFPSLLDRKDSFIVSMKTPIARISGKGKNKDILFYDERRFNEWLNNQNTKHKIKYYKGLGTTKTEDVPDTFGLKMVEYVTSDSTHNYMNKAFHKDKADERKDWLASYDSGISSFSLDDQPTITKMKVSDFIDTEMIKFSFADCGRSIPSFIDGFKESQRKILFAVMKRKLKYSGQSLKVAQLSGYTAEHSNYHHGEQNLQDTIIGMAHDFVGSNNIPLLYRDGQFGSRLDGGADAASPRYIFTKMDSLTEYIFREEDEPILKYVNDDGDYVQPEYYVPIIPMILVNGSLGIGTGWSSSIPCYNPLDITRAIREWLDMDGVDVIEKNEDGEVIMSMFDELKPWYRNFKGTIEKSGDDRFITKGVIESAPSKKNNYNVTELPIGMWTNKFKEFCEDLLVNKNIKDLKNYSTPKEVKFTVTQSEMGINPTIKTMKLHSYLYTSNMVGFDSNNMLKKYKTIDEIIDSFCKTRYIFYEKRKVYQIELLKKQLNHMINKMKFIEGVISNKISVMNQKEDVIIKYLEDNNFDKEDGTYSYLLSLQVRTFTREKVDSFKDDIKKKKSDIKRIQSTSEKDMWISELDEFEKHYAKFK